jgi:hypothetical protein
MSVVLALLLTLFLYVGMAVVRTGTSFGYFTSPARIALSLVACLAAWAALVLLCSLAFRGLDALALRRKVGSHAQAGPTREPSRWLTVLVFVIILACWAPFIVLSFPASINFDYFNQLSQFVGDRPLSNHHPVLTTWVFGLLYQLGHAVAGARGGLFLTVAVQALALDALFSCVHRWMCRMGARRGARIALVAFAALCPVLSFYSHVLTKDVFSAVTLGFFALQLVARAWADQGAPDSGERELKMPKFAALPAVGAVGVLCSLTRGNCVYVVLVGLLAFACVARRGTHLRVLLTAALVAAAYLGWNNALVPAVGARPSDSALVLSIPLQQTAAYARDAGDATPKERSAIQAILDVDYDQLGGLYDPAIVDPVKTHVKGLDDAGLRAAYLAAWRDQGLRHPAVYLDTFLRANVGYWYPLMSGAGIQDLDYFPNTAEMHYLWMQGLGYPFSGILSNLGTAGSVFEAERTQLGQRVVWLAGLPFAGLLFQPAFYAWACLVLGAWMVSRRSHAWPVFAMSFVLWAVCCVSPLNASLRYALPLVVLFPVMWASVAGGNACRARAC